MFENEIDGALLGTAVTHKILDEIQHLVPIEDESQASYFNRLDNVVKLSDSMVAGFELVRGAALAIVEDLWTSLPMDVRRPYDFQFRVYAEKRCPNLAYTTIQNHLRVGRNFVLKGLKPKDKVEIIVRGENGKPVLEAGQPKTELVEFDPMAVGISKLVLINSSAQKGKLDDNPKLWSMVADPTVRFEDVRAELFSKKSEEANIDLELRYELLAGILIAKQNGDEYPIIDDGGFKWEEYYDTTDPHHEIVKLGMDRLFGYLGVKPDEEILKAILSKRHDYEKARMSRRLS